LPNERGGEEMIKKFGIIMAVVLVVSIVSGFMLYVDVSNDFQPQKTQIETNEQ
jgi:hypothetical protein